MSSHCVRASSAAWLISDKVRPQKLHLWPGFVCFGSRRGCHARRCALPKWTTADVDVSHPDLSEMSSHCVRASPSAWLISDKVRPQKLVLWPGFVRFGSRRGCHARRRALPRWTTPDVDGSHPDLSEMSSHCVRASPSAWLISDKVRPQKLVLWPGFVRFGSRRGCMLGAVHCRSGRPRTRDAPRPDLSPEMSRSLRPRHPRPGSSPTKSGHKSSTCDKRSEASFRAC
jgi:hypothetical protein